jgi:uncharacterized Ntn-hydrolase superfamily protein
LSLFSRRLGVVVALTCSLWVLGTPAAHATWSIVAVDEETGEVGVAVASCVGFEVTVVPVLTPGIGAAASQADISRPSGTRLVESLAGGATAEEVVEEVVAADDAPEDRQFGVVVLGGGGAGWTGSDTLDVALDVQGRDGSVSAQGNILVSQDVVTAAIDAFERADGELADRLVVALVAGADAGGDSRCGDQTATAAALIVARPGDQAYAHTDAGVLGVDPDEVASPFVFVSVLVPRGGERAPDRLSSAWASADRSADEVVIREVDPGADTDVGRARSFVGILLAIVALVAAMAAAAGVRAWRRRSPTR